MIGLGTWQLGGEWGKNFTQDEVNAMLRRARVWHELATGFLLAVLCERQPDGTAEPQTTNVLAKALAGQASLVV